MDKTREGAKLVEFLHLAFLQVLPTRLPVTEYVVKGGANLRLFYNSRRRSQDIDLDYIGAAFWRAEERVDA
ncbi:MAG: nucleotidyl transferase AbiEii/AbiGii toxin family protein, partial [Gemmatimonadota bacterium]